MSNFPPQNTRERQEVLTAIAGSVLDGDEDWQTRYADQINKHGFTEDEINQRAHAIIEEHSAMASGHRPAPGQIAGFVALLLVLGGVASLLVSGQMLPIFGDKLSLGESSIKDGNWDKAEQYFGEVLKIHTGSDPRSSISRAEALAGMARVRLNQGRYQEAETMVQNSLKIRKSVPAHERPINHGALIVDDYANGPEQIADDLSLEAEILSASGKKEEAEKIRLKAKTGEY